MSNAPINRRRSVYRLSLPRLEETYVTPDATAHSSELELILVFSLGSTARCNRAYYLSFFKQNRFDFAILPYAIKGNRIYIYVPSEMKPGIAFNIRALYSYVSRGAIKSKINRRTIKFYVFVLARASALSSS